MHQTETGRSFTYIYYKNKFKGNVLYSIELRNVTEIR